MNIFRKQPLWAPEGEGGGGDAPKPDASAAPAGDAKPAPAASFLANADDTTGDDKVKVVAPANWPDDWRDKISGGDAAARKRLDRFAEPGDIFKSYTELEGRFKKGAGLPSMDEPMPDGEADPDGLKAWRDARGIPDDPTGYTIPDAVKDMVTDDDKPLLASFTESMHAKGISRQAVGPVLEWYFQQQDSALQTQTANDKKAVEDLQDELRTEWGSEFRANSTLARNTGKHIFGDLPWTEARLPDGRRLGDIPEMTRALARAGAAEFGDVSFSSGELTTKTEGRETELKNMMRDDPDKYFGNPAYSQELQKINEAKEKRGSRQ